MSDVLRKEASWGKGEGGLVQVEKRGVNSSCRGNAVQIHNEGGKGRYLAKGYNRANSWQWGKGFGHL